MSLNTNAMIGSAHAYGRVCTVLSHSAGFEIAPGATVLWHSAPRASLRECICTFWFLNFLSSLSPLFHLSFLPLLRLRQVCPYILCSTPIFSHSNTQPHPLTPLLTEQFTRAPDARPYAAIVWSGSGSVNGCVPSVVICIVSFAIEARSLIRI